MEVIVVKKVKVIMMKLLVNVTPAHSMFVPKAVGVKVTFLCSYIQSERESVCERERERQCDL